MRTSHKIKNEICMHQLQDERKSSKCLTGTRFARENNVKHVPDRIGFIQLHVRKLKNPASSSSESFLAGFASLGTAALLGFSARLTSAI